MKYIYCYIFVLYFFFIYLYYIFKIKNILNYFLFNIHYLIKNREKDIYIVLSEHADNALIFTFRMPVNTTNYWDARFEVLEQVKKAFDEEGISIPYPQLDVHLDK